jgi:hypothetical protein
MFYAVAKDLHPSSEVFIGRMGVSLDCSLSLGMKRLAVPSTEFIAVSWHSVSQAALGMIRRCGWGDLPAAADHRARCRLFERLISIIAPYPSSPI